MFECVNVYADLMMAFAQIRAFCTKALSNTAVYEEDPEYKDLMVILHREMEGPDTTRRKNLGLAVLVMARAVTRYYNTQAIKNAFYRAGFNAILRHGPREFFALKCPNWAVLTAPQQDGLIAAMPDLALRHHAFGEIDEDTLDELWRKFDLPLGKNLIKGEQGNNRAQFNWGRARTLSHKDQAYGRDYKKRVVARKAIRDIEVQAIKVANKIEAAKEKELWKRRFGALRKHHGQTQKRQRALIAKTDGLLDVEDEDDDELLRSMDTARSAADMQALVRNHVKIGKKRRKRFDKSAINIKVEVDANIKLKELKAKGAEDGFLVSYNDSEVDDTVTDVPSTHSST
jgi:hypothetical protein